MPKASSFWKAQIPSPKIELHRKGSVVWSCECSSGFLWQRVRTISDKAILPEWLYEEAAATKMGSQKKQRENGSMAGPSKFQNLELEPSR